jgi:Domain of Unknown Function with PDB structure (DUF3857)/Transglutaminase-like superfamily
MEISTNLKPTKMRTFLYLLFITNMGVCLNAQQSQEYNLYKNLYPNANSVRLNQNTTITIKLENEDISINQRFEEEDLYLDESATYNSKKALHFSSFFELENVEASSFIFADGKYKEQKVSDFKEKDQMDQSFYADSKSLNFIYPNLKNGSKSLLKYTENVKNPRFLSSFYFADFSPIINNTITIIADKNIDLKFIEFNMENLPVTHNKQEKKGNNVFTWEVKNTNKYEYESNAPTYKKILPHIIPVITGYQSNGKKIELANQVSDLYKWYYSLVKDINKDEADDDLIKLVKDLTANKPNDFEKVKAMYYWVQNNIKYIAFEYALGGFIPRQANDVFQKKYGDCKDNSSILYKMFEIAGIKGSLTWIGTRSIPYSYNEVPTPLVDNHMILSYTTNDKTYFLDATGRHVPIDFPTSFIQGKQALIADGESNFIIKEVPVMPSKSNALIDSTFININGENLVGKSRTHLSGYKKIDLFNYLESEVKEDKIKEFYNVNLEKGNNKFLINTYEEINKYDYYKDFNLNYEFTINNYIKKLGDEIYVNLNLNKELSNYKTKEDRKHDIEYDYKNFYSYTTTLHIPEGYTVEYIPNNVNYSNAYLSANISYTKDENSITYTHTANLDFLSLTLSQQKEVNDLIKKIEKEYKEVIILKKS